eukprot:g42328.t1
MPYSDKASSYSKLEALVRKAEELTAPTEEKEEGGGWASYFLTGQGDQQVQCDNCLQAVALLACLACEKPLCQDCDAALHHQESLFTHRRALLGADGSNPAKSEPRRCCACPVSAPAAAPAVECAVCGLALCSACDAQIHTPGSAYARHARTPVSSPDQAAAAGGVGQLFRGLSRRKASQRAPLQAVLAGDTGTDKDSDPAVKCSECRAAVASLDCPTCRRAFCRSCDLKMHRSGPQQLHLRTTLLLGASYNKLGDAEFELDEQEEEEDEEEEEEEEEETVHQRQSQKILDVFYKEEEAQKEFQKSVEQTVELHIEIMRKESLRRRRRRALCFRWCCCMSCCALLGLLFFCVLVLTWQIPVCHPTTSFTRLSRKQVPAAWFHSVRLNRTALSPSGGSLDQPALICLGGPRAEVFHISGHNILLSTNGSSNTPGRWDASVRLWLPVPAARGGFSAGLVGRDGVAMQLQPLPGSHTSEYGVYVEARILDSANCTTFELRNSQSAYLCQDLWVEMPPMPALRSGDARAYLLLEEATPATMQVYRGASEKDLACQEPVIPKVLWLMPSPLLTGFAGSGLFCNGQHEWVFYETLFGDFTRYVVPRELEEGSAVAERQAWLPSVFVDQFPLRASGAGNNAAVSPVLRVRNGYCSPTLSSYGFDSQAYNVLACAKMDLALRPAAMENLAPGPHVLKVTNPTPGNCSAEHPFYVVPPTRVHNVSSLVRTNGPGVSGLQVLTPGCGVSLDENRTFVFQGAAFIFLGDQLPIVDLNGIVNGTVETDPRLELSCQELLERPSYMPPLFSCTKLTVTFPPLQLASSRDLRHQFYATFHIYYSWQHVCGTYLTALEPCLPNIDPDPPTRCHLAVACNFNADLTARPDASLCDFSCYGCRQPTACNYDPLATRESVGLCKFCNGTCPLVWGGECPLPRTCRQPGALPCGCTDPNACNFDFQAKLDDESCYYNCTGCMDPDACAYDPFATVPADCLPVECAWTNCSVTCGGGVKFRDCSQVAAGQYCNASTTLPCNLHVCPVDGGWTHWSQCSVTCGSGFRYRTCTNPKPVGTGLPCNGSIWEECSNNVECVPVEPCCEACECGSVPASWTPQLLPGSGLSVVGEGQEPLLELELALPNWLQEVNFSFGDNCLVPPRVIYQPTDWDANCSTLFRVQINFFGACYFLAVNTSNATQYSGFLQIRARQYGYLDAAEPSCDDLVNSSYAFDLPFMVIRNHNQSVDSDVLVVTQPPCRNDTDCVHGSCVRSLPSGLLVCVCDPGWAGTTCDIDIDPPGFLRCPTNNNATIVLDWRTGTVASFASILPSFQPPVPVDQVTAQSALQLRRSIRGGSWVQLVWDAAKQRWADDLLNLSWPVGSSSVWYQARDAAGNNATCAFLVLVVDHKPPQIACPPSFVSRQQPNWPPVNGTDFGDPNVRVEQIAGPRPGNFSTEGKYLITYRAVDAYNNSVNCSFNVTYDYTPPTLHNCPPSNLTLVAFPHWTDSATLDWTGNLWAWDALSGVSAASVQLQPATLVRGTTRLVVAEHGQVGTFVVYDVAGNMASCPLYVRVVDATPPNVTCPTAPIYIRTEPGKRFGLYPAINSNVSATDNVGVVYFDKFRDDAQYLLARNATHVQRFTACDAAGNCNSCSFLIIVYDPEPPVVLSCPADLLVAAAPQSAYWSASWPEPTFADNDQIVSINTSIRPPAPLPIGTHVIVYTAQDAAGNTVNCSFVVTVRDTEPPTIECPTQIIVVGTDLNRNYSTDARAWTNVSWHDNSEEVLDLNVPTWIPPLGTPLSVGTTTFILACVSDQAGLQACCFYGVIVRDLQPPNITCGPGVAGLALQQQQQQLQLSSGDVWLTFNWNALITVSAWDNVALAGPPTLVLDSAPRNDSFCDAPISEPGPDHVRLRIGQTNIVHAEVTDTSGNRAVCEAPLGPFCGDGSLGQECWGGSGCVLSDCLCDRAGGWFPFEMPRVGCSRVCLLQAANASEAGCVLHEDEFDHFNDTSPAHCTVRLDLSAAPSLYGLTVALLSRREGNSFLAQQYFRNASTLPLLFLDAALSFSVVAWPAGNANHSWPPDWSTENVVVEVCCNAGTPNLAHELEGFVTDAARQWLGMPPASASSLCPHAPPLGSDFTTDTAAAMYCAKFPLCTPNGTLWIGAPVPLPHSNSTDGHLVCDTSFSVRVYTSGLLGGLALVQWDPSLLVRLPANATNVTLTSVPPSSVLLPVGLHVLTVVASNGQTASFCRFPVVVLDGTSPRLEVCPDAELYLSTDPISRLADVTLPSVLGQDYCDGTLATVVTLQSQQLQTAQQLKSSLVSLRPGVWTVQWEAMNSAGNSNNCSGLVVVVDDQTRELVCESPQLLPTSAGVAYTEQRPVAPYVLTTQWDGNVSSADLPHLLPGSFLCVAGQAVNRTVPMLGIYPKGAQATENGFSVWNLFDGSRATIWTTTLSETSAALQLSHRIGLVRYALQTAPPDHPEQLVFYTPPPKNWRLWGSFDGNSWALLDTRRSVEFGANEWMEFEVAVPLVDAWLSFPLSPSFPRATARAFYRFEFWGGPLALAEVQWFVAQLDALPLPLPVLAVAGTDRAALDGSLDTAFVRAVPATLEVRFPWPRVRTVIARYSLVGNPAANAALNPSAWRVEGLPENGDGVWTLLDNRTNQLNWQGGETRSFSFANERRLKSIRLVFLASAGGGGLVRLPELWLEHKDPALVVGNYTATHCLPANNSAGQAAVCCNFTVLVRDVEPPVLSCPLQPIETWIAQGDVAHNLTWSVGVAENNWPALQLSASALPGLNNFSLGVTVVRVGAVDSNPNNNVSCEFLVIVHDVGPPLITCPVPRVVNMQTEPSPDGTGMPLTLAPAVATDNSRETADVTATYWLVPLGSAPSNQPPAGADVRSWPAEGVVRVAAGRTIMVRYIATDGAGTSANCTTHITVRDRVPPAVLFCPGNVTLYTSRGFEPWPEPLFADNVAVVRVNTSYAGGDFPVGFSLVWYRAVDAAGNVAFCNFTVIVLDDLPPSFLNCPGQTSANLSSAFNVSVESALVFEPAAGSSSFAFRWRFAVADDLGVASLAWRLGNASGLLLPQAWPAGGSGGGAVFWLQLALSVPSSNIITLTALDLAGNRALCSFSIQLLQTALPELRCPANLTRYLPYAGDSRPESWAGETLKVFYPEPATLVLASGNLSTSLSLSYSPPSGSLFPLGLSLVTVSAVDSLGRTIHCVFAVDVLPPWLPPDFDAVLILFRVTPTPVGLFQAELQYLTAVAAPYLLNLGPSNETDIQGLVSLKEDVGWRKGCLPAEQEYWCEQSWSFTVLFDSCDQLDLRYAVPHVSKCQPGVALCLQTNYRSLVVMTLIAQNYCAKVIAEVAVEARLTTHAKKSRPPWSEGKALGLNPPLPALQTFFEAKETVTAIVSVTSPQVLLKRVRLISAMREEFADPGFKFKRGESVLVSNSFPIEASLVGDGYVDYAFMDYVEPGGGDATRHVRLVAEVEIDYAINAGDLANRNFGRRRQTLQLWPGQEDLRTAAGGSSRLLAAASGRRRVLQLPGPAGRGELASTGRRALQLINAPPNNGGTAIRASQTSLTANPATTVPVVATLPPEQVPAWFMQLLAYSMVGLIICTICCGTACYQGGWFKSKQKHSKRYVEQARLQAKVREYAARQSVRQQARKLPWASDALQATPADTREATGFEVDNKGNKQQQQVGEQSLSRVAEQQKIRKARAKAADEDEVEVLDAQGIVRRMSLWMHSLGAKATPDRNYQPLEKEEGEGKTTAATAPVPEPAAQQAKAEAKQPGAAGSKLQVLSGSVSDKRQHAVRFWKVLTELKQSFTTSKLQRPAAAQQGGKWPWLRSAPAARELQIGWAADPNLGSYVDRSAAAVHFLKTRLRAFLLEHDHELLKQPAVGNVEWLDLVAAEYVAQERELWSMLSGPLGYSRSAVLPYRPDRWRAARESLSSRVTSFFQRHSPQSLGSVERVLRGVLPGRSEQDLWEALMREHGLSKEDVLPYMRDEQAEMELVRMTARVERFFKEVHPSQLHKVERIVQSYAGDEDRLWQELCDVYGLEVTKPYLPDSPDTLEFEVDLEEAEDNAAWSVPEVGDALAVGASVIADKVHEQDYLKEAKRTRYWLRVFLNEVAEPAEKAAAAAQGEAEQAWTEEAVLAKLDALLEWYNGRCETDLWEDLAKRYGQEWVELYRPTDFRCASRRKVRALVKHLIRRKLLQKADYGPGRRKPSMKHTTELLLGRHRGKEQEMWKELSARYGSETVAEFLPPTTTRQPMASTSTSAVAAAAPAGAANSTAALDSKDSLSASDGTMVSGVTGAQPAGAAKCPLSKTDAVALVSHLLSLLLKEHNRACVMLRRQAKKNKKKQEQEQQQQQPTQGAAAKRRGSAVRATFRTLLKQEDLPKLLASCSDHGVPSTELWKALMTKCGQMRVMPYMRAYTVCVAWTTASTPWATHTLTAQERDLVWQLSGLKSLGLRPLSGLAEVVNVAEQAGEASDTLGSAPSVRLEGLLARAKAQRKAQPPPPPPPVEEQEMKGEVTELPARRVLAGEGEGSEAIQVVAAAGELAQQQQPASEVSTLLSLVQQAKQMQPLADELLEQSRDSAGSLGASPDSSQDYGLVADGVSSIFSEQHRKQQQQPAWSGLASRFMLLPPTAAMRANSTPNSLRNSTPSKLPVRVSSASGEREQGPPSPSSTSSLQRTGTGTLSVASLQGARTPSVARRKSLPGMQTNIPALRRGVSMSALMARTPSPTEPRILPKFLSQTPSKNLRRFSISATHEARPQSSILKSRVLSRVSASRAVSAVVTHPKSSYFTAIGLPKSSFSSPKPGNGVPKSSNSAVRMLSGLGSSFDSKSGTKSCTAATRMLRTSPMRGSLEIPRGPLDEKARLSVLSRGRVLTRVSDEQNTTAQADDSLPPLSSSSVPSIPVLSPTPKSTILPTRNIPSPASQQGRNTPKSSVLRGRILIGTPKSGVSKPLMLPGSPLSTSAPGDSAARVHSPKLLPQPHWSVVSRKHILSSRATTSDSAAVDVEPSDAADTSAGVAAVGSQSSSPRKSELAQALDVRLDSDY